jgi:hypothetical protein
MPYLPGGQPLDQPVVTGVVMWLVGLVVPDGSALMRQQWYFALWAVLVVLLVMALVAVTAASVPRAPWRAAHVALSPVLVVAGLVSVDLLGVMLASVALWAWGRNKIWLAGFALGLAISARSYPLVLLVAIGLLALRSGRLGAWVRLAATAFATCLAVVLPWFLVSSDALLAAYRAWWGAGAGYGSVWMLPALLRPTMRPGILASVVGNGLDPGAVTALAILGWALALVVGAYFALSRERRPTVAEVCLVMLVIVVVTGKAMPVQAGLWLLPLIALVGLTWRDHLIWAGFEVTYFVSVWLYIAGLSKPDRGLPARAYSLLVLLRVVAWLYVLVQVWREASSREPAVQLDPELAVAELDPDLAAELDPGLAAEGIEPELAVAELDSELALEVDPLAGPMAGAPDKLIVKVN